MIDVKKAIERGFRDAPFVEHLGIELEDLGAGWCEAGLALKGWHLQQTGVAHAGSGFGAFSTSTRHMRQFAAIDSLSW